MSVRRVALVVGSGGVKCAAALGLARVLEREGIQIDRVVGCSGGSIFAAAIAAKMPIDEAMRMFRTLWTPEVTARLDRGALARLAFPRLLGFNARFGLRRDRLIMERLRAGFGEQRIEAMPIRLHLTATDFANGEQAVFSRGRLVDAIRASLAIPFMFAPWEIDGRLYTDGFLSDPLPVGVAIREGAQAIVAMGFESPYMEQIRTGARFAMQVSSILSNNLLRAQFAFHGLAHHGEVVPVLPQFRERIRLFDTGKLETIVADGERAAEDVLPHLQRLFTSLASHGLHAGARVV